MNFRVHLPSIASIPSPRKLKRALCFFKVKYRKILQALFGYEDTFWVREHTLIAYATLCPLRRTQEQGEAGSRHQDQEDQGPGRQEEEADQSRSDVHLLWHVLWNVLHTCDCSWQDQRVCYSSQGVGLCQIGHYAGVLCRPSPQARVGREQLWDCVSSLGRGLDVL